MTFDSRYPSIDDLREKARRRIPRFAFEYLDGGCNEDVNLAKNVRRLREVELVPRYLQPYAGADLSTELFGHRYDAPFGIAPVGLQGLMWPNAAEILARSAHAGNIPFMLSTVTTSDIERIGEVTEGNAWFQLYHPADNALRDHILTRLEQASYRVLVVLCDVPVFGFRPRDVRNGLSMPPKMTLRNILDILQRPAWALETLVTGSPEFKTLKPYMKRGMNLSKLGAFMNETFNGRIDEERLKALRDRWKGVMVLKGVASEEDAARAIEIGIDGIIVSNHGGRQIDMGQASVDSLVPIAEKYKSRIKVMMDSGVRSGADVARALASGAEFAFLGRSFMYSVAALGDKGGDHCIALLKTQLQQVMEQLSCKNPAELEGCRVRR